ncbi:mechanosensitive ion channel family protein [Desulfoplanes sp.]
MTKNIPMTMSPVHPLPLRFWMLTVLVAILFAPVAVPGTSSAQNTTQDTSAAETRFSNYFDVTLGEIQEIIDSRKETTAQVETTLSDLADNQEKLEQELRKIKGMARIVRGRPYETRGILQDLRGLSKKIQTILDPAEQLLQELNRRHEQIGLLAAETDHPWTEELPPSLKERLTNIKRALTRSGRILKSQQTRVAKGLGKAKDFDGRAQNTLESIEKALPGFWKRLLFSSQGHVLSPELWQNAPADLRDWIADIPTFLRIQLPSSTAEWIDWTGKVVVYWLLLVATTAIGLRRSRVWEQITPTTRPVTVRVPWLWMSLALALLGTFLTAGYRQTSLQLTLVHLSLFYGTMRMAWAGRLFKEPGQGPSPLRSVFLLYAGAAVLQLIGLPHPFSTLVWMGLLGLGWRTMVHRHDTPLLLERILARTTPFVYLTLFILAFFGLLQLSLLMAQVWALAALMLQVVVVATGLLRAGVERFPPTLGTTVLKGVVMGFGSPLIWILGLSAVLGWLAMHLGSDFVFKRISTLNLSWGDYSLNFFRIAVIIVLFYLTHAFGNIWGSILDQKYFRWSKIDPGILASLRTTGGYAIWIVSGIIAVNIMGIRLTSLAVIAGGLSVGIGFGLQNLINNFISGLILLFGRTIQAGDIIQLDQLWGSVRKINIRNTEIQTFDNSIIFVPNSELISGRLTNWTHRGDCRLRRDLPIGVAYGSDIERVKTTLMDVAGAHPHVLTDPPPTVLFKAFGASSLDFVLRVWVDHIDFSLSTLSELHEQVNAAFATADIEISFPQMDIHVRDSVPFKVNREDTTSS